MKNPVLIICAFVFLLVSCIGDDFVNDTVDPVLRITSRIDSLEIDTEFQFEAMYLNNVGIEESVDIEWLSSQPDIIEISASGLALAKKIGTSSIRADYNNGSEEVSDFIMVSVGSSTVINQDVIKGTIKSTSSYELEGSFELARADVGIKLSLGSNYTATTALPGLYVYLSNNRNSISGALEIAKVTVFSGAHSYEIMTGLEDYKYIVYFCKPFNVKVGEGEL